MQLHPVEPYLHAITLGVLRHRSFSGEQRQLRGALAPFIERFDDLAPRLALAVVDLTQIKYGPLHHPATRTALALDNTPIAVLFAVLAPPRESQIHAGDCTSNSTDEKLVGLHYRRFTTIGPCIDSLFLRQILENRRFLVPVEKVGLAYMVCRS